MNLDKLPLQKSDIKKIQGMPWKVRLIFVENLKSKFDINWNLLDLIIILFVLASTTKLFTVVINSALS